MRLSAATLRAIMLAIAISASAQATDAQSQDHALERPVHPFQCEEWEALIEERLESDDPLERSLGQIYGHDDYSWCQTQRTRVREQRESRWDFNLPGLGALAEIMRLLAIAGLGALVIWALWRWRRQIGQLVETVGHRRRKPLEAARQEPVPEQIELPPDISAKARELWNEGHPREAASLLYRGALTRLLAEVRNAESRTEREVQRLLRARGLKPGTLAYMDALILCWQRTAWAHQPPGKDEFECLLDQWPQHCLQPLKQGGGS